MIAVTISAMHRKNGYCGIFKRHSMYCKVKQIDNALLCQHLLLINLSSHPPSIAEDNDNPNRGEPVYYRGQMFAASPSIIYRHVPGA